MLRDNLFNKSIEVLVFLFNAERRRDTLKDIYDPKFIKDLKVMPIIDVSKILNITYSHTFKIVNDVLIPLGLVNIDKLGRCSLISLTEKGLDVGERLDKIFIDLNLRG